MSKYPLPIAVPKGLRPVITQPFGSTQNASWYVANGIAPEHNGIDIAIGTPVQTYGTKIVCPVPESFLSKQWWDQPMSTKGNGIEISWKDGKKYKMRAWHCSEIKTEAKYSEGDVIGFIGNSGLVRPAPSVSCVHCGAHLHLMLYEDGVLIDPLSVFDKNRWFESEDTGLLKDLPPLVWGIEQLNKLFELFKTKNEHTTR